MNRTVKTIRRLFPVIILLAFFAAPSPALGEGSDPEPSWPDNFGGYENWVQFKQFLDMWIPTPGCYAQCKSEATVNGEHCIGTYPMLQSEEHQQCIAQATDSVSACVHVCDEQKDNAPN